MSKTTGRGSDQFNLRLPDGMRYQLKEEASQAGRSLNAEIVYRLSMSLGRTDYEGIGVGEQLEMQLTLAAEAHGRSFDEEVIRRLQQSFLNEHALASRFEDEAREAKKKYSEILRLFIQLTPEERRLLEERAEIMEDASRAGWKSKDIGKFVNLNSIGNRGRIILTQPKSDYSPLFSEQGDTTPPREA
ncbi:Arc family DNA-binding protein [Rhizobium sp. BR 250]